MGGEKGLHGSPRHNSRRREAASCNNLQGAWWVAWRESLRIPANVRVRATTNRWMTAGEYHHWLQHVIGREEKRCLLVVNSYKPHQAAASIEIAQCECNADVVIIPGGCTSIVQPMDRCINKPFKDSMRVSWEEWMRGDRLKTMMELKIARTTRRHELGIESLVLYQARNASSFLPRLWHLQRS